MATSPAYGNITVAPQISLSPALPHLLGFSVWLMHPGGWVVRLPAGSLGWMPQLSVYLCKTGGVGICSNNIIPAATSLQNITTPNSVTTNPDGFFHTMKKAPVVFF